MGHYMVLFNLWANSEKDLWCYVLTLVEFGWTKLPVIIPTKICLFKVNNTNTRKMCETCSKLIIKRQTYFAPFCSVSIADMNS